jgi:small-conductance mechanosensitive channel
MWLQTLLQTLPQTPWLQDLVDLWAGRLAPFLEGAGLFVVTALLIYLPGRFLVVPGARRLMDWAGTNDTFELPFLKVLHAAIAVFALFNAAVASDFSDFLQATEAVVAGATIAIGFASKDVLNNLVSGVFIVADPKFNIGDWIQWNGQEGIIEDISFRVTRVHTFNNELISVPNSELTANAVTNPVAKEHLRSTYQFGVGYESDLEDAKAIIVDEALAHPDILDRPRPSVRVQELAPSAVTLQARFWVRDPAQLDLSKVRSEYIQGVKERFDRAGIEMPYPYQQLTGSIDIRGAERRSTDALQSE